LKKISNLSPERVQRAQNLIPRIFELPFNEKVKQIAGWTFFACFTLFAMIWVDFSPLRIINGVKDLGWLFTQLFPPSTGGTFFEFFYGLLETLGMAFLGTLFGFLFALPLGFLAAKNIVKNKNLRFLFRRLFDIVRGINALIWALMFIHVVGLGPFAGIIAITISDTATMAKLFSESIENVDMSQIEGTSSTGANKIQIIRYAYIPQVLPVMLSNALYFFESNVRQASILGILGAGGIGMQLYDRIRIRNWQEVCFIIIMILVTVAIIDNISKRLRSAIIAQPDYRP
jgi:phosphonate transport system permease protein